MTMTKRDRQFGLALKYSALTLAGVAAVLVPFALAQGAYLPAASLACNTISLTLNAIIVRRVLRRGDSR